MAGPSCRVAGNLADFPMCGHDIALSLDRQSSVQIPVASTTPVPHI